ncbi:MAG: hypothetical protein INH41_09465 [Myxococcaceae bacterium]|nr:hypothetical protein [Myxococcaceae bacterium]MCA3012614.1 hypothetical protein [Myxococcaceae bacterium]
MRATLRASNPVFQTVELRASGAAVECRTPPVSVFAAPDAGVTAVMGLDGKPSSATHQWVGETLVQKTWSAEGVRETRFVPAGDGLTLHVEVSSPRLPVPLRYQLQYTRATP